MRHVLRFVPTLLVLLTAATCAVAEPLGSHYEFTPMAGQQLFDANIRFPGSTNAVRDGKYLGLRFGYQSAQWLGLELAYGVSPTSEDIATGARDYDFQHVSGNLTISPAKGRWGGPYAFVGFGNATLKPAAGDKRSTSDIEFGGGIKWWLNDDLGLRFEARDASFATLNSTGPQQNLHNVSIGVGLTFALGATPRDTDGDGVPDKKDKCPNTPRGATVDANGCPSDSDKDGVLDGLDKCPNTPTGATIDANGCPSDSDGDGVFDGLDQCPDTPKGATVDAKGCPSDSDKDGVLDGLDKCPNTPAGAKVDASGCPIDSDGDGVYDGLDQCPDTPKGMPVDEKGCPKLAAMKETELETSGMIRLTDIHFQTGKDSLLADSYQQLDAVAQALGDWPMLKIEIGGHTDSRGSSARNLVLSQGRAAAVRAYLLAKNPALSPKMLTAKGYGKKRPIAPNDTPENMAKNRRVDMTILNADVFKKELEKRHATMSSAASDSLKK